MLAIIFILFVLCFIGLFALKKKLHEAFVLSFPKINGEIIFNFYFVDKKVVVQEQENEKTLYWCPVTKAFVLDDAPGTNSESLVKLKKGIVTESAYIIYSIGAESQSSYRITTSTYARLTNIFN